MTVTAPPPERTRQETPSGTPAPSAHRRGPLRILWATLVWLLVVANLFVLLFLVLSSLKDTRSIMEHPWSLPLHPHFDNFARAWNGNGLGQAVLNTVLVVATAAVACVLVSAPAAYVLSRSETRMAGLLTVGFALGLGIPLQVMVLPLFVVAQNLHLVNSLVGLFILYTALNLPFTVFLLTGFFRSLPDELEEAAALDGCSPSRTFVSVMLPLARGGLITALLINVIHMWNETFVALMFIQTDSKQTLSLALLGLMQKMQYNGADFGGLFAGVTILVLPMVILYIWLGRRIIEGLTMGAGR